MKVKLYSEGVLISTYVASVRELFSLIKRTKGTLTIEADESGNMPVLVLRVVPVEPEPEPVKVQAAAAQPRGKK